MSHDTFLVNKLSFHEFQFIESLIKESKLIDDFLPLDQSIQFIKNKFAKNRVKIFAYSEQKNVYLGFAIVIAKINTKSLQKFNWHISYLFVKKEHRRKKIANKIIQKCIEYAKLTDAHNLSLNTSIDNIPAQNLYQSFQFKRKDFIGNYFYYELDFTVL